MKENIISKDNKKFANWALNYALENGCQASRVTFVAGTNNSMEYRDLQIDSLENSTEYKLYIELFVDNKYGSYSSNRLEKDELETFIKEAIISTKYLAEDKCRQLPDNSRYYKGNDDLELYDKKYNTISAEEKHSIIQNNIKEIYKTHADIISITASFSDSVSGVYMKSSNGFENENIRTSYSLVVSVSLKTQTDARSEGYWYDISSQWDTLQKEGLGKIALKEALNKVGQKKIESGKYAMLLDNMTVSQLLSPLFGAANGASIQQKNSFLIDKIGHKMFSDKITVTDKPHQKEKLGSKLYDGEGIATEKRVFVEKGILKHYFIDTYNGLKLNTLPTIASPSGICIEFGKMNNDELIKTIDKGIWVTGFNGGNTNATTGDFSFGIEGFLIENGEIIKPVSEMNITGNLLTLWNNIIAIGNNPRRNIASQIPSILFADVSFSGL